MMLLKIRNLVCFPIGYIGAIMWNSAFKKGTQDNYDDLTFLEKVGFNMMAWYIIKGGLIETTEEISIDELENM